MKGRAMRAGWVLLGLLTHQRVALANERYQALPLAGAEGGKGGARAFILDTRDAMSGSGAKMS